MAPARSLQDRASGDGQSVIGSVTTFEGFALGTIDGQFDWQSTGGTGALPGSEHGVYDHEIADAATFLTGRSLPRSIGHRSLRISNAVTSGAYSDQTFSNRTPNVAGQAGALSQSPGSTTDFALPGALLQNHFEAEWTLTSTVPDALQPGLEVVASPARGDDRRMGWLQMADTPEGLVIVVAKWVDPSLFSAGAILRTTIARRLDRREAHRVKLTMDFVDGPDNDIVRVYVDGALRYSGASWENYYAFNAIAPPAVNRLMFRTGSDLRRGIPGDAAGATIGKGFIIDNLRQATFMVARSVDACRNGGWQGLRDADGEAFEDQDDCVEWVRHSQQRDGDRR